MTEVPAGGGSIAARFVALDATARLAAAEIVWDRHGTIVRIGRPRSRLQHALVLPGLVNAHAHLQLGALPSPSRIFPKWIEDVMANSAAATPEQRRRQLRRGLAALLASGTTAVGEIDSTGQSWPWLQRRLARGRCYRELTGYHLEGAAARALVAARMGGRPSQSSRGSSFAFGLSPHAPYSVSPDLFRAAAARCRHLAIHCAEVPEEQEFLHTGRGPFADLLARLSRLPPVHRPPGVGAVAWLATLGVLRPTTTLVHCQELERGDLVRLASAGVAIVVCPGTIEWFRRQPPAVAGWLRAGIPVALGTDSMASNRELSMRRELALAARLWPGLAPRQLLAMATAHGGRALQLPAVGRLRLGHRADLVVVPAAGSAAATLAGFVHGELPIAAVLVAGKRVRQHAEAASR